MHDADLLASDAEREAAAGQLRAHLAEGRLTTDEFGERIAAVYAARTRGEVAAALARLPAAASPAPPRPGLVLLAARQAGYSAITAAVCVLVWAFTGADASFWPKWVILALLVAFVSRVGKAALGDEEARAKLERRHGGGPPSLPRP